MNDPFIRGTTWELLIDAQSIPAGQYRFLERTGELLTFTIGHEIQIVLTEQYYRPFLRRVPSGDVSLTALKSFTERHVELILAPLSHDDPAPGMAFCVSSPKYIKRIHKLLSVAGTFSEAA